MFLNKVEGVLFDLDGTLLDTHKDLCNALNVVLTRHGKPALPIAQLRPFVSKGAMVMVCLAFHCKPQSEKAHYLWLEMLDAYTHDIARETVFFPGMEAVIDAITTSGKPWGIVTNKPGKLTTLLLDTLELPFQPAIVISGDTLDVKKPHPAPLLLASKEIGIAPNACVYIGDDERDIKAGKSAGMFTIAATYGYIVEEENPAEWGADELIKQASDITSLLNNYPPEHGRISIVP